MAEPTPVTMACPKCRQVFTLPTQVVQVNQATDEVLLRVNRADIRAHYVACSSAPARLEAAAPKPELVGRIHLMLDRRDYIATGGSRACSMCGVNGQDCLVSLEKHNAACCAACHNGNTHPAPKCDRTCAEWAAEFHKADQ